MVTVMRKEENSQEKTFEELDEGTIFYDYDTDDLFIKADEESGFLLEDGVRYYFSSEDNVALVDTIIEWWFTKN